MLLLSRHYFTGPPERCVHTMHRMTDQVVTPCRLTVLKFTYPKVSKTTNHPKIGGTSPERSLSPDTLNVTGYLGH
jgi:hypothetical protein